MPVTRVNPGYFHYRAYCSCHVHHNAWYIVMFAVDMAQSHLSFPLAVNTCYIYFFIRRLLSERRFETKGFSHQSHLVSVWNKVRWQCSRSLLHPRVWEGLQAAAATHCGLDLQKKEWCKPHLGVYFFSYTPCGIILLLSDMPKEGWRSHYFSPEWNQI